MVVLEGDSGDAKPITSEESDKEVKSPRLLSLESILLKMLIYLHIFNEKI